VECIDEQPAAVLSNIKHHLCEAFAGLIMNLSTTTTLGAKLKGNTEEAPKVDRRQGTLIALWLCERKKLRNGRPHLVWTSAKIACSSTK
jgi:hypothetical protein